MGYFDESETFTQSCPGGIKKEPIVERSMTTLIPLSNFFSVMALGGLFFSYLHCYSQSLIIIFCALDTTLRILITWYKLMTTTWTLYTNANLFFWQGKIENWQIYGQAYISMISMTHSWTIAQVHISVQPWWLSSHNNKSIYHTSMVNLLLYCCTV